MDKIREKIASIRAEADAANEKAENYYKTIKELENQLLTKEQDIVSLTHRNGQLENELERAQEKIAQLKVIEEDEDGLKKVNDAAQRKIALLEQELESSENLYREATQNFRLADVKAEHFERKVQQYERTITGLEDENEELKNKIRALQAEIDEFNASLADI